MKTLLLLAALASTSAAFANQYYQGSNANQRYYQSQGQGYDYNQSQPYYQSQGQTYYQTQPQTQNYNQNQGYYNQQPQQMNSGYISQGEAMPSMTATPQVKGEDTASTEQDKQINAKIRDKLKNLNLNGYETIILRTQNGIVMITGSVEKVDDLMKIRDQVKSVEGVKTVNNQVTAKTK